MHQILSRISLAITTHGDLSSRIDQIMQALSEYYSTGQILTAISDNKNGRAELVFTPGHGFKAQNRFRFSEFISGPVERDSR